MKKLFLLLHLCLLTANVKSLCQPIMLVLPADGDTLVSPNPSFNWTPLVLLNNTNTRYAIRIVQILEGQSPEGAIVSNPPHFEAQLDGITAFIYPLSASPFLPCSTYAWQIRSEYPTAEVETLLVASEVWSFTTTGPGCSDSYSIADSVNNIPPKASYAVIRSTVNKGYYHTVEKKFYFKFDNIYIPDSLNFSVFNSLSQEIAIPYSLLQKSGPNQYVLDLSALTGFDDRQQYLFVVRHRNKVYRVKFEYRDE